MLFTNYKTNISLYPQSKQGKQFVRIRVSSQSSRVDLYTGISLTNSQWDKKKQQVKQGCVINNVAYNIINSTLGGYMHFINHYFENCAAREVPPSLEELKKRFEGMRRMSGSTDSDDFFYLFDEFIAERSKERGWTKTTKDVYVRLKEILQKFQPNIKFSNLSIATMNKLVEYMSQTMYNDAISKRLTYLRSFVKWAQQRKYTVNDEFFRFTPRLPKAKKEVRYLELEELHQICEMELLPDSALDRVRDMFVFQCYTALRCSDIQQLKNENIHYDAVRKKYFIDLLTEKDDDRISFPLSERARTIYLKYKDRGYANGLLFPVISNQKYNDHLKELGEMVNLQGEWIDYEYKLAERIVVKVPKKDLASHSARRTFIVTAINEGIDPFLIALITSHSDLKSMRPYITKTAKGATLVIDAIDEAERKAAEVQ